MGIPLRAASSHSSCTRIPSTDPLFATRTLRNRRRLVWFAGGGLLAGCICCVGIVVACFADRWQQFTETGHDVPTVVRVMESTGSAKVNVAETLDAAGRRSLEFSLPSVTHDVVVHLRDLRGQLVVLIFGSFSCDVFCDQAAELERLYQEYKDCAKFLLVQIQEAGHKIPTLDAALKDVPRETSNRRQRARRAMEVLHLTMPAVTDNPNKAVEYAYGAFPEYFVILDRDGKRAVDIGCGLPSGWDFGEIRAELNKLLQTPSQAPSTAKKPKTSH